MLFSFSWEGLFELVAAIDFGAEQIANMTERSDEEKGRM